MFVEVAMGVIFGGLVLWWILKDEFDPRAKAKAEQKRIEKVLKSLEKAGVDTAKFIPPNGEY